MDTSDHISVTDGITIIQFNEDPSFDLLMSIMTELHEKELYPRRLWDLRGINFNLPEDKLRALAEYGRKHFTIPNRAAFVVDNNMEFVLIKLVSFYRWEGNSKPQIFYNYSKAIEFLAI